MFEGIILGIIQGIAEWLPISSEGALVLAQTFLFSGRSLSDMVELALFLHLGTLAAAVLYLRKDIFALTRSMLAIRSATAEQKSLLRFLIISTAVSGIIGFILWQFLSALEDKLLEAATAVQIFIGLMLLVTAWIQFRAKKVGMKTISDLAWKDALLLGILQGFSVLPGISRSGVTVSAFLLRKFDDIVALRVSFLMSIPVVLAGAVFLQIKDFQFNSTGLIGLLFSFLFGFATISILMRVAQKISFAYFVFAFGLLVLVVALIDVVTR